MARHRHQAIFAASSAAYGSYYAEATDNYVTNNGATAHTQSAGSNVAPQLACILAVALPVKYSGIFMLSCDLTFSASIAADAIVHQLVTVPVLSPATLFANGTTGGWIGRDAGGLITSPGGSDHTQVANADYLSVAASGITFNGVAVNGSAAGATIQYTKADPTYTATLTGVVTAIPSTLLGPNVFDYTGIISKDSINRTPFQISTQAVPSWIVAGVSVQSLHAINGVTTYATSKLTLQELAFQ